MGRTAGTEAYRWDSTGCRPHIPWGLRDGTDSWDRAYTWDSSGCPSPSVSPLGTEGWDGQLRQRPTNGTPRDVPHSPHIPWGLRAGMDSWDRGL